VNNATPDEKRDRVATLRLNKAEDEALSIVSKHMQVTEQEALRRLVMMAAGNLKKCGILNNG
jgi:hypothetical protein